MNDQRVGAGGGEDGGAWKLQLKEKEDWDHLISTRSERERNSRVDDQELHQRDRNINAYHHNQGRASDVAPNDQQGKRLLASEEEGRRLIKHQRVEHNRIDDQQFQLGYHKNLTHHHNQSHMGIEHCYQNDNYQRQYPTTSSSSTLSFRSQPPPAPQQNYYGFYSQKNHSFHPQQSDHSSFLSYKSLPQTIPANPSFHNINSLGGSGTRSYNPAVHRRSEQPAKHTTPLHSTPLGVMEGKNDNYQYSTSFLSEPRQPIYVPSESLHNNILGDSVKQLSLSQERSSKSRWTNEEMMILMNHVLENGERDWNKVPEICGLLNRSVESCKKKWAQIRPEDRKCELNEAHKRAILRLYLKHGKDFHKIAKEFRRTASGPQITGHGVKKCLETIEQQLKEADSQQIPEHCNIPGPIPLSDSSHLGNYSYGPHQIQLPAPSTLDNQTDHYLASSSSEQPFGKTTVQSVQPYNQLPPFRPMETTLGPLSTQTMPVHETTMMPVHETTMMPLAMGNEYGWTNTFGASNVPSPDMYYTLPPNTTVQAPSFQNYMPDANVIRASIMHSDHEQHCQLPPSCQMGTTSVLPSTQTMPLQTMTTPAMGNFSELNENEQWTDPGAISGHEDIDNWIVDTS